MKKQRNIGIEVPVPQQACSDKKCPFHGKVRVRGRSFIGIVKRIRLQKNALVEWERRMFIPKYERYEKRRTRVMAHNPLCLGVKEGDSVVIYETRKLSKTKNFVIVQKLDQKL